VENLNVQRCSKLFVNVPVLHLRRGGPSCCPARHRFPDLPCLTTAGLFHQAGPASPCSIRASAAETEQTHVPTFELAEVDELCAKLITLAPPKEALPLLSEPTHRSVPFGREPQTTPALASTEMKATSGSGPEQPFCSGCGTSKAIDRRRGRSASLNRTSTLAGN
jgi:hypothetical protein